MTPSTSAMVCATGHGKAMDHDDLDDTHTGEGEEDQHVVAVEVKPRPPAGTNGRRATHRPTLTHSRISNRANRAIGAGTDARTSS